MTKTTVWHTRTLPFRKPADVVYIGRPSKWGNPFVIGIHGNRDEVVAKYKEWFQKQPDLIAALPELVGKRLACFCKPFACHGDYLAELANALVE